MEAYTKHYNEGKTAADVDKAIGVSRHCNPYTGPGYAGGRGKAKHDAWDAGYKSVTPDIDTALVPKVRKGKKGAPK